MNHHRLLSNCYFNLAPLNLFNLVRLVCDPEHLGILEQLYCNPFVVDCVDQADRFCALMGVSAYLQEDAFRNRYQRKWSRTHQPSPSVSLRDSGNGDLVWQSEDDCLGTVALAAFSREATKLEEMARLSSVFGTCADDSGGLVSFYHKFDKETFESTVIPYLSANNAADSALYNHAVELVRGLPDPVDTPASDIWRWGVWWNAVLTIYVNFRKQSKPPPIPRGAPKALVGAVDLYSLPQKWSDEVVVASDKSGFEEFERKFLQKKNPACKFVYVDGKELAYVPGVLDPFTLYGSAWIVLPPFSEWKVASRRPVSNAVPAPPSRPATSVLLATSPATPSCPKTTFNVDDGLDVIRDYLARNYVQKTDLNKLPHHERYSLKQGIIAEIQSDEGKDFFQSLSKRDLARLNELLPYEQLSFPDMVTKIEESGLGSGTRKGISIFLAAKLVLSRSQFSPTISGGEIFVTRN